MFSNAIRKMMISHKSDECFLSLSILKVFFNPILGVGLGMVDKFTSTTIKHLILAQKDKDFGKIWHTCTKIGSENQYIANNSATFKNKNKQQTATIVTARAITPTIQKVLMPSKKQKQSANLKGWFRWTRISQLGKRPRKIVLTDLSGPDQQITASWNVIMLNTCK